METPRPYRQRTLRDGTILREFRSDAHPDELVWHQDRSHRSVRVLESGGWKLQLEEGLPFPLVEGNTYEIPSRSWHRVIRGPGDLKIEIMEGDNVRITESQLRKIIREEIEKGREYYLLRTVQEPQYPGDLTPAKWTVESGPFRSFSDVQEEIRGYDRVSQKDLTIALKDPSGGFRLLSRTTATELGIVKPGDIVR